MKQEEKTEITRQKILNAAMEEFGNYGYVGGAVNNICKTGINKGLIYHNFKNKEELYLQCVEKSCEDLICYVHQHGGETGFVQYMNVRMSFFKEYVSEANVFLEARTNPPRSLAVQIQEIFSGFDELNRQIFEQELSRHPLRPGVSKEDAMSYFFEIQKIYNFSFANEVDREMPLDRQLELHELNIHKVFDLILYGIAKVEENR